MCGRGGGAQVGCERRIEVFVQIQKTKLFFLWGGGVGGSGGRVGLVGVKVDVIEELKFLGKLKKKSGGAGVRIVWGGGFGNGGGSGWM